MTSLDLPEALFLHPLSSARHNYDTPFPPLSRRYHPSARLLCPTHPHFPPSSLRLRRTKEERAKNFFKRAFIGYAPMSTQRTRGQFTRLRSSTPTSSSVCQLREKMECLPRAEFDDVSSYRGCTPDNHYASSFTACSYGCDFLEWILPMISFPLSPHTYLYFPLFPPVRASVHTSQSRRGQTCHVLMFPLPGHPSKTNDLWG